MTLSNFDQEFLKKVGIAAWLPDADDSDEEPAALVLEAADADVGQCAYREIKTVAVADMVAATGLDVGTSDELAGRGTESFPQLVPRETQRLSRPKSKPIWRREVRRMMMMRCLEPDEETRVVVSRQVAR